MYENENRENREQEEKRELEPTVNWTTPSMEQQRRSAEEESRRQQQTYTFNQQTARQEQSEAPNRTQPSRKKKPQKAAWQKEPELNLMQFLQKLAQESGFEGELTDLSDDILIYHLKMRDSEKDADNSGD